MSKHKNHAPNAEKEVTTEPQSQASPEPSKEIVNKQTGEVTEYRDDSEVLRSDMIIPYLTIQQGTSDFVQARKTALGDICKSTNPAKLGDPENPVEAIFLHCPKPDYALEMKKDKNSKFKFKRVIERNSTNEHLPWTYWSDENGLIDLPAGTPGAFEWKRVKRLSVFAILTGDITMENIEKAKLLESDELPDPSKALTPVALSFRVMSYSAGKEVLAFYTQAKSMGVPIWRYRMPLGAKFESNGDNSYYVWTVDRTSAKAVSKADLPLVNMWAQVVSASKNLNVDADEAAEPEERAF